jgi:hypothetical protein
MLLGVCWVIACGGGDQVRNDMPSRARHQNLSSTGFRQVSADLDHDGQADQWSYLDEAGQLVRAERDIDFNGSVDVYEYYGPDGLVVEEEIMLDFDDQVDSVRFYNQGVLVRRELSTAFDGRFNLSKHYDAQGNVLRVDRDGNGDGRMDTWEYFENGQVVRVGRDADGDGTPEIVETP